MNLANFGQQRPRQFFGRCVDLTLVSKLKFLAVVHRNIDPRWTAALRYLESVDLPAFENIYEVPFRIEFYAQFESRQGTFIHNREANIGHVHTAVLALVAGKCFTEFNRIGSKAIDGRSPKAGGFRPDDLRGMQAEFGLHARGLLLLFCLSLKFVDPIAHLVIAAKSGLGLQGGCWKLVSTPKPYFRYAFDTR
jgi:hypothetical protein